MRRGVHAGGEAVIERVDEGDGGPFITREEWRKAYHERNNEVLALRKENEQLKSSKAILEQQVASINNALRQWALEVKP